MSTTWTPTSDYEGMTADTQRQRVKDILRSAIDGGICSLSFYSLGLPNGRTRVYELRDGSEALDIETRPCKHDVYHRGEKRVPTHVRFIWWWHGNPRQPRLRGI